MHIYHTFQRSYELPDFPYTNDKGLSGVADSIAAFNLDSPIGSDDCAVIVGTGALLSLADLMPPHVYITDKDPALLFWMQRCVRGLLDSDSSSVFLDKINPKSWQIKSEIKILGDRHFLAGEANYDRARAAMGNLSVQYVDMDYSYMGEAGALADHIKEREQRVRLFNATNVHAHVAYGHELGGRGFNKMEYGQSLGVLPWADNYRIMASSGRRPKSWPLLESLAEYQYGLHERGMTEETITMLRQDPELAEQAVAT